METRAGIALLVLAPALTAVGQALLRAGMKATTDASPGATAIASLSSAFGHPSVIAGLLLYGACAVLWMLLLGKFELSFAYPFVGLSFIFSLGLAVLFLGESVNWMRTAGTLVVVLGVIMVASSR